MAGTYYVCLLKNFNNYFNRIIKGYDTILEYETAVGANNFYIYDQLINFSFADNVSTELVMNNCPFAADYLLLMDKNYNIVSRWFILDDIYTRQGQRKLSLRRDLIFDYKDNLANSPAFIQKAMLQDDDPLIFNPEGMSFNEIKKSETLLKDNTNCAWIVGYIARNAAPSDISITVPDADFVYNTLSDIATAMGIREADLSSLLNFDGLNSNESRFTSKIEFRYGLTFSRIGNTQPFRVRLIMSGDLSSTISNAMNSAFSWEHPLFIQTNTNVAYDRAFVNALASEITTNKSSILSNLSGITSRVYLTDSQLEILRGYLNTPVFYNGNYYELSLSITGEETDPRIGYSAYTTWPSIATAVQAAASDAAAYGNLQNDGEMAIFTTSTVVYIQMQKISDESGKISGITSKISSSRRNVLDQVFDMFAIPYGSIKVNYIDNGNYESYNTRADAALTLAAAIAAELDVACYDIQLLPYCPITDLEDGSGINIEQATEGKEYNFINKTNARIRISSGEIYASVYPDAGSSTGYAFSASYTVSDTNAAQILDAGYIEAYGEHYSSNPVITKTDSGSSCVIQVSGEYDPAGGGEMYVYIWYEIAGTQHYSLILWANKNSFSKILNYNLTLKDSMKVESQCNKYRIVSPNYQGSFDFNVAKNGGSVPYFIADCTYRPYTPYLKIAPAFSYMYGTNYGDCRGLICSGDFSLPRFTSAWESYQLNNKNYQNIFNREIQNLDFEQSMQFRQQAISGGIGIAAAGIGGAAVGAKVGGVYGAIAGAVIGTAGSTVGYATDLDMLGQRQKEARDYSIDKFNFQLGNIKALPYTLTKVGSFDINSKIWPFLEYYTCTDEEKAALENKIIYESMTVMRVDTIGNYFSSGIALHYLKCELIRNEEIAEDNHVYQAIYNELAKGVYI